MLLTEAQLQGFNGLTVIPDLHGMYTAYQRRVDEARQKNHFIIQLGDHVDRGPQIPACVKLTLELLSSGEGAMVVSNHDFKFDHYVNYRKYPKYSRADSLKQFNNDHTLLQEFFDAVRAAPTWLETPRHYFAHGAYFPDFVDGDHHSRIQAMRDTDVSIMEGVVLRPDWSWEDEVPNGKTLVLGHHIIDQDFPTSLVNDLGGKVIYLDTGAYLHGDLSILEINIADI